MHTQKLSHMHSIPSSIQNCCTCRHIYACIRIQEFVVMLTADFICLCNQGKRQAITAQLLAASCSPSLLSPQSLCKYTGVSLLSLLHSLKGEHAWTIIPPPPLQRQPSWPNSLCGGRVYCGQGEKKNAWGIEVQIRWMENQGPDVWNEKLLRWLLLYISELQFWKFLQKLKQFYRRSHN